MFRIFTTAVAALVLATPLAAASQELPSYAESARAVPDDQQIRGRITSFDGGYALRVHDDRGFDDYVALHPGTIINPTGLTLAPGMVVSILGYNAGGSFAANEIDTPYTYSAGVPYYAGHAWNYYGPSVSLGFFFGNAGWWHGSAFRGNYTYIGGARYYNDVHVRNVYRGRGQFDGRNYVAPHVNGGYYHASQVEYQGARGERDRYDGYGRYGAGTHGGNHGDHGGNHGEHGGHGGGRDH